jgi:hypothetical protein
MYASIMFMRLQQLASNERHARLLRRGNLKRPSCGTGIPDAGCMPRSYISRVQNAAALPRRRARYVCGNASPRDRP